MPAVNDLESAEWLVAQWTKTAHDNSKDHQEGGKQNLSVTFKSTNKVHVTDPHHCFLGPLELCKSFLSNVVEISCNNLISIFPNMNFKMPFSKPRIQYLYFWIKVKRQNQLLLISGGFVEI